MTLRQLKPIEKNGSGEYKAKPAGVVLSLSGVVAALVLSGNILLDLGAWKKTAEYNNGRISELLTWKEEQERRSAEWRSNQRLRMTRMEVSIAELQTLIQERTDVSPPLNQPRHVVEDASHGF